VDLRQRVASEGGTLEPSEPGPAAKSAAPEPVEVARAVDLRQRVASEGGDDELEALLQRGYRYAYALTGDPARADDLLQDAWSSVLEADGPHHAPYLFRVMRNRWIDVQRRARIVEFEVLEPETVAGSLGIATGESAQVLAAMGRLRPEEREALFLCAVEGWTANEVSERTGQPRNTVLSLVHRGRARLRQLLGLGEREVVP
jgi:RNA polymerase sigma factor (sigma-70 family)